MQVSSGEELADRLDAELEKIENFRLSDNDGEDNDVFTLGQGL